MSWKRLNRGHCDRLVLVPIAQCTHELQGHHCKGKTPVVDEPVGNTLLSPHISYGLHMEWDSFLVLGSLVQSGFLSIFDKTETETIPPFLKFPKTETRTVIDRSTAVLHGFLWLQDWSEPVMVQTSL